MELTVKDDSSCGKYQIPGFLKKGRDNPVNGMNCFFTESSFKRVISSEPSFEQKFMVQLARAKERIKEEEASLTTRPKTRKDLDLPKQSPRKNSGDVVRQNTSEKSDEIARQNTKSPLPISNARKDFSEVKDTPDKSDDSDDDLCLNIVIPEEISQEHNGLDESASLVKEEENKSDLILSNDSETDQIVSPNLEKVVMEIDEIKTSTISSDDTASLPVYATVIPHPIKDSNQQGKHNTRATTLSMKERSVCLDIPPSYEVTNAGSKLNSQEKTFQPTNLETNSGSKFVGQKEPPHTPHDRSQSVGHQNTFPQVNQVTNAVAGSSLTNQNQKPHPPISSQHGLPLIPALMGDNCDTQICDKPNQPREEMLRAPDVSHMFHSVEVNQTENKMLLKTENSPVQSKDVSIFSVATGSPGKSIEGNRPGLRNKSVWSEELVAGDQQQTQGKGRATTDYFVKEAMKFRQSSLTREEMILYLRLFDKYVRPYHMRGIPLPMLSSQQAEEMDRFTTLQERVCREQEDFQAYLYQNAVKNPHFYRNIKPTAIKYASTRAESYRSTKFFVNKFCKEISSQIPLNERDSHWVELTFDRTLLEMGLPPKITFPELHAGKTAVSVPHDMRKLQENFPSNKKNRNPNYIHHERVADDFNAQALAIKFAADAVISSSALKCLLDNVGPDYSRAWNIPVVVKEHMISDVPHKTVYLNKPIFEGKLEMRAYNALFHKYALRTMISLSSQPRNRRSKIKGNPVLANVEKATKAADDVFDIFSTDFDQLETFGKASGEIGKEKKVIMSNTKEQMSDGPSSTSTPKQTPKCDETLPASSQKETFGTSALSAEPELASPKRMTRKRQSNTLSPGSGSLAKPEEQPLSSVKKAKEEDSTPTYTRRTRKVVSLTVPTVQSEQSSPPQYSLSAARMPGLADSSNPLDLILGPGTGRDKEQQPSQEDPSEYLPGLEPLSSLVYNMWHLGEMKVISRTRTHGVNKGKNVYVTAKMEYQANHGYEQVTPSEMVRDWAACLIRPNSKLVRARINPYNSEIMMFEELEAHQILKSSSKFRPENGLSFLRNLLKHLSGVDAGNYVLSHEPGADYCGLRRKKEGARLEQSDLMPEPALIKPVKPHLQPGKVPWIPIDPTLMLPYHIMHQRIPATFLPKDIQVGKQGVKPQREKLSGKQMEEIGNKRKKKNQQQNKKNKGLRELF